MLAIMPAQMKEQFSFHCHESQKHPQSARRLPKSNITAVVEQCLLQTVARGILLNYKLSEA